MKPMDRRQFCRRSLTGAVGLSIPGVVTGCGTTPVVLPPSGGIHARVAAVTGTDLFAMTREALEEIGGMAQIVSEGETVFIKPNFVNFPWAASNRCFQMGECTKPEMILAVTEECLKAGASKVIIGEGSHLPTFDWKYAITLDGKKDLVSESVRLSRVYGGTVELACLETDSPSWSEVPSVTARGKIAVSSLVTGADRVISIPVAKTHSWARLTLSTKNFLGITPLSRYAQLVDNTWWNRGSFDHRTPRAISQVFLDITGGIRPDLAVIDFSIGLEGDGPTRDNGGETVDMRDRTGTWAVLASRDLMAADATAARIMDHEAEKIEQLVMGFEMDLGEIRKDAIEIVGEPLENLTAPWKHARLKG